MTPYVSSPTGGASPAPHYMANGKNESKGKTRCPAQYGTRTSREHSRLRRWRGCNGDFIKANIVSTPTSSQLVDRSFAFAIWYLAPHITDLIVLAVLAMGALR
jgi:hypothetical protein